MKLDRNIPGNNGRGKYAIVKLRKLKEFDSLTLETLKGALELLEEYGVLDYGDTPKTEFFVLRLKDYFAQVALTAYAKRAESFDSEYAHEVSLLAARSGPDSLFCKTPE